MGAHETDAMLTKTCEMPGAKTETRAASKPRTQDSKNRGAINTFAKRDARGSWENRAAEYACVVSADAQVRATGSTKTASIDLREVEMAPINKDAKTMMPSVEKADRAKETDSEL